MEPTYLKIIRKTGRKPTNCKCQECKKQCMTTPCLGTPDDIEKIIDAGYAGKLAVTQWKTGMIMNILNAPVPMVQPLHTNNGCAFFIDGLCELHTAGLKPTEGKLSHHSLKAENFKFRKSLSWNIAKVWLDPDNLETIKRIFQKIINQ